jgi:trehalose/maltose hydrolase-like predicted phosphorylase
MNDLKINSEEIGQDDDWNIEYKEWNNEQHPLREALCTLGNGYFATRGAMEESGAINNNYPGTYLAGGYNRAVSIIHNKEIENEDLVNWPNWLCLTFKTGDGAWFEITKTHILEYKLTLNLKEGVLERYIRFGHDKFRETSLISRRIVSMHDPHVAAIEWQLTPENWSDKVTFLSGIDGNIENAGVKRYLDLNRKHLDILEVGEQDEGSIFITCQSRQSKIRMTQASRLKIYVGELEAESSSNIIKNEKSIYEEVTINCTRNETVRLEKLVTLYSSRDTAISDTFTEALTKITEIPSFNQIFQEHKLAWAYIWNLSSMDLKTSGNEILLLRLHLFHLHQTVSENSIGIDMGVPSRGWHGEAYRGHIFWDELYIFPFIFYHIPELARSLLLYRYHRLPKAKESARKMGFRGAMFPWQSGSNGREESQVIHLNPKSGRWIPDHSKLQRHINAAIPYNVWQYYQATGDKDFLGSFGAELILNTALFWSDIAEFNKEKNRFEIKGVMGPDEYHTHYPDSEKPGLDNNAYTNFMAAWNMKCALNILEIFKGEHAQQLSRKVGFNKDIIDRWKQILKKMYIPFNRDGIILQFDGFDHLKELDWQKYRKTYGDALRLDRILEKEGDSPNNYRATKQADALMLFYLFSAKELEGLFDEMGYNFKPDKIPQNIKYYEQITAHGSTLSQVIHSWIYARSHRRMSWLSFKKALLSDFNDIQGGTTPEGIHLGAMAGTIDIIQRCYTGMEIRDDILWLNPKLPDEIEELSLQIRYRSHWIKLKVTQNKLHIKFDKGWADPVKININGQLKIFDRNDSAEFEFS